ncbi:MAG: hypothetical protein GY953_30395 [bacterium]|nr:hypothetical protein [bacterium]
MLISLSLVVISVAAGIVLLWVFRKTSNQRAIRATKKRLQARLLEMRLYADDPGVVWRAQKKLLALNAKYFALMLRPAVVATIPMVLLLVVLDGFYGMRPLMVGQSAIVTVQLRELVDAELAAPAGIEVETPAVRAVADRQVSWRIRPSAAVAGDLRISTGGQEATKSVRSGEDGGSFLSVRRVQSLLWLWLYPGEMPLPSDGIEWIELRYPAAEVSVFGLATHWLVWFLLFSMVSAFLLKGRFGVTV